MKHAKQFKRPGYDWGAALDIAEDVKTGRLSAQYKLLRLMQSLADGNAHMAAKALGSGVALDQVLLPSSDDFGLSPSDIFIKGTGFDESGITPLIYFSALDQKETVEWLIKMGASPTMVVPGGKDSAWAAMEAGGSALHEMLLVHGAFVHMRLDSWPRQTRLIGAADIGSLEVTTSLLKRGAKVNRHDAEGRTALAHNLMKNPYSDEDLDIAKALMAAGADVFATGQDAVDPIDLMTSDDHLELLNEFGLEPKKHTMLPQVKRRQTPQLGTDDDKSQKPQRTGKKKRRRRRSARGPKK